MLVPPTNQSFVDFFIVLKCSDNDGESPRAVTCRSSVDRQVVWTATESAPIAIEGAVALETTQLLLQSRGGVEEREMTSMRRAGATSAATLFGLVLAILFVHAIAPDWIHRSGLDVWNLPSAIADNRNAGQLAVSLSVQEEQLYREIELSNQVTAQMAAGTLSLEAAINEMEPILRNRNGFAVTMGQYYHVSTFRQGVARYLMSRVPRHLLNDRDRLTAIQKQLEQEFAQIK